MCGICTITGHFMALHIRSFDTEQTTCTNNHAVLPTFGASWRMFMAMTITNNHHTHTTFPYTFSTLSRPSLLILIYRRSKAQMIQCKSIHVKSFICWRFPSLSVIWWDSSCCVGGTFRNGCYTRASNSASFLFTNCYMCRWFTTIVGPWILYFNPLNTELNPICQ